MKRVKTNYLLKTFFTLALAFVMCVGTALPALAVGGPVTGGTELNPLTAAITKTLKMPEGTTPPTAGFIFQFSKKSFGENTTAAELKRMPDIGTVPAGETAGEITIPFTSADTGAEIGGTNVISKQSGNILGGVTFASAGEYTYILKEKPDTYTVQTGESLTYSGAEYEITFYVKNNSAGTGTYVYAISAKIVTPDSGSTGTAGDKVDPTPGDGSTTFSDLLFTNIFAKKGGGTDPTDPAHQALAISKTVTGDFGDKSKYFDYTVTATKPALFSEAVTYKAYVLEGNTVVTSAEHTTATLETDTSGYTYFEITADTPTDIKLKHGQRLVFTDIYIGARYEALEHGTNGYTPAVNIIVNGGTQISQNAAESESLSTNNALDNTKRLIGENKNAADFINDYTTNITPTGVVIDNLPFIMILVLAAGAFVALILVKSRKRRRYTSGR